MTNTELWYYQYMIKAYNEDTHKDEMRGGLVAAHSFTEAITKLDEYYDIETIQSLKPITDMVFDFEDANRDEQNFDFIVKIRSDRVTICIEEDK